MKKLYSSIALILLAVCFGFGRAAAQDEPTEVPTPTTSPSATMNLEAFPEGLCVFVVNQMADGEGWTVNTKAKGYITLERDGVAIRQIPASNRQRLKTFVPEGEGEIIKDNANLRITFYDSASNPANASGNYTITIPAGFLYFAGNPELTNPEWVFNVKCSGADRSPLVVSPTAGKTYSDLSKFTVTLPDAINYRFAEKLPNIVLKQTVESTVEGAVADVTTNIPCTVTTEGVVATIIPDVEPNVIATYTLTIPKGFAQVKKSEDTWADVTGGSYVYKMSVRLNQPTIEPSTSETYSFFPAKEVNVMVSGYEVTRYSLFTLTLDQDFTYMLMSRPIWCPVDDNGNFDTNEGIKLAIAGNGAVDKRTMYVLTESIDGGDFLPSPGKYALVIPSGCFYLKDASGNQAINPEFVYYYNVGVNTDFKVRIKPADKAEVADIQFVTVTFDEGVELKCNSNAYGQLSNGIAVYALPGKVNADLTNEVYFSLDEPLTELGDWTFSLPTSGFTVNGSPFTLAATYSIVDKEPVDKTCIVTPAEGKVEELSEFHISFPAYDGVFGREGNGGISLVRLPDTEIALGQGYYDEANGYFLLPLEQPVSEPGYYRLTILPDTFWVGLEDGFSNNEVIVNYIIEENENPGSVADVDIETATGDVYNATGIRVLRQADIHQLRKLDKGLYIFCGKKVIVR